MKIKRKLYPLALTALGVFLGRGAQADTIIDFDARAGANNAGIFQDFGDYAAASSDGVTVTGFGTPNIGLTWQGMGDPATRWEFYTDSVWSAGQLNHSIVGTANQIIFTPNNASARVVVKSFNFHPYYDFATYGERFTYDVSVLSGATVVSGPLHVSFRSDGTKAHPININYTGAPGQTLKLRLARVASTLGTGEIEGDGGDIAADDITFAQLPTTVLPVGPQVVSVKPGDDETGVAATAYSYLASITNGDSTVVASSIKLKFDGTLVPTTISSDNDVTNVSSTALARLASGSTHVYTLTYNDSVSATYTNETAFIVAVYPTLPASYASPLGSGSHPGFIYRTVVAPPGGTRMDSTVARAKAQLAGTLIDPATSQPYGNIATPGTNSDGSWNIDTVINFLDSGPAGNFFNDEPFPGLDTPPYDWFATEATLYLNLPAGYYRMGVGSDDGFEFSATPLQGVSGSPIVLGLYDNGRAPGDTMFDFLVQTPGVYPFKLVYFESDGGAECELYSVNLATGDKILVNDITNPSAILSYRGIPPRIVGVTKVGGNVVLSWAYGNPPYQLQYKTTLNGTWNNLGPATSSTAASIAIQPGAMFFRVGSQP